MPSRPRTLDAVQRQAWLQLARAAVDRGHEWRAMVLATGVGDAADARVVILREVDVPNRRLTFYTDDRAAKLTQLREHPHGTLVLWSRALGWQLRCRVHLQTETSGLAASSRWVGIQLTPAAQDYLSPRAPGMAVDQPLPPEAEAAREHFSVVHAQVLRLDWLALHPEGHRRAVFDEHGSRWVQP